MKNTAKSMEKITSLLKRRGFIYPGSLIYGGLQNTFDYGPLGVEMKKNIKDEWWNRFVRRRSDIVGLDSAILMNTKVWEASGHLAEFSDPLVEDKITHERFRLDHLLEQAGTKIGGLSFEQMIEKMKGKNIKSPNGNELTDPRKFNLMLKTSLGATLETSSDIYLRPETAQGMFVDFKQILESTRKKIPFGVAQIGKAFRNEITPGNFIFRTREFEQMEIEYFILPPKEDKEWMEVFNTWQKEMEKWIEDLGILGSDIHILDVPEGERAHYSKKTIDFEYEFPFGVKELYGLAYRGDFDLQNHIRESGQDLSFVDEDGKKFVPHVIEPTFGVDRTTLAVLVSAYDEERVEGEVRTVLRLPNWLSPIKVAVLPLSKKEELINLCEDVLRELSDLGIISEIDITQSIGKRYRRFDEIGTPYCVTVDFDTLEDKKVTVRDRDTMKQERVALTGLGKYLKEKVF